MCSRPSASMPTTRPCQCWPRARRARVGCGPMCATTGHFAGPDPPAAQIYPAPVTLQSFQPTSVGQNRADRFAFAEQFETFVDLREWQHIGDQIIDVDLAAVSYTHLTLPTKRIV